MSRCQICAVSLYVIRLRTSGEPDNYINLWDLTQHERKSTSTCSILNSESGCEDVQTDHGGHRHIPGRNCTSTRGYSGTRVSYDDMLGSDDVRYIVMKPKDGKDYPYRRYYEEGSDYHLPPISSPVPRELQGPMYLAADNQWLDLTPTDCPRKSKGDTLGVPVHNWCWKLFEQASMMYGRNVDLQGFMALWNRDCCRHCAFRNLKHPLTIRRNNPGGWRHRPGTEYLACNPWDIPGFMVTLFDSVASPSSWRPRTRLAPTRHNKDDIFMELPSEIINSIILHMAIEDVLKVRNVSKAFWRLDTNVFRKLIERDFPWFWEFEEFHQTIEIWNRMSPIQVHQQELLTSWRSGFGLTRQPLEKHFYEPDWFAVYQQLQILQYKLPGLKNRKRIWALIEDIMYRIDKLREDLTEELTEEGVLRLPAIPSGVERYPGMSINWRECIGCKNLGQVAETSIQ